MAYNQNYYRYAGVSDREMYRRLLRGEITQRDYDMHSHYTGFNKGQLLVNLGGII